MRKVGISVTYKKEDTYKACDNQLILNLLYYV